LAISTASACSAACDGITKPGGANPGFAIELAGHVDVDVFVREVTDCVAQVIRRPRIERDARHARLNRNPVVVDGFGRGEHAHDAHDGETNRDERRDDGETGRYPSEVEGETRTSGYHEVAKHSLRKVNRTCRAPEGGGDDEPKDVHDARYQIREDVVAARWTVGLWREGVPQESDKKEQGRKTDIDNYKGDHEAAALA
jgi:hypothetical protein